MTSPDLADAWTAIGETAAQQVAALAAIYQQGTITGSTFAETAAARIYLANAAATRYADAAVSAWMLATTGVPTPALGLLPPPDEQARLVHALSTIVAHGKAQALNERSQRVARSEPLNRGRTAYQAGLRARGVEKWRRVVQPDACPGCASMVGQVRPMSVELWDHPGCKCSLAPVVPETWGDQVKARQYQLRRVSESGVRVSYGLRFSN